MSTLHETNSLWLEEERPHFGRVNRDATYDAVIVGAGITGLTAAYLLKRAGKKVAVIEKGRIADAETGHTTAHLTQVLDTKLTELADRFGKERARLAWEGSAAAINTIEAIAAREGIQCHFQRVPGFLMSPITKDAKTDDVQSLEKEADLARELGFDALFVSAAPVFNRPAVRFANQAAFHPLMYLSELAKKIPGDGCDIFEESAMNDVLEEPLRVEVEGFRLHCEKLIIATHVPLSGKMGFLNATLMQSKLAGYSTYVIGAEVEKGTVPHADFWDTQNPYYYLRVEPREHTDYLIFENQFIATGFAGNGMTFGTLSGMMACDWVLGRDNPWADLFSTDRRALRKGLWEYLKENFSYPHYLIRGYLVETPEADSVAEVQPGEGKVLKMDGHRCAVYRDHDGQVTTLSAVCTHMGCLVRWNKAAETWDCPCHGSRFNTQGEVVAGPAESPLEKKSPARQ
jgi:glycine/D-amino acid oxidase-like deaminating enzyme/nitrite reductase/ring-hydroxylating ferredoxin subunit